MTLTLAIACGAAETIGALVAGDEIVRFFFAPARGDETLARAPEAGDIVLGRIKTIVPSLGGAFVDIGAGEPAFLSSLGKAKRPSEGALDIFRVRRPAIDDKGAVLDADWNRGLTARQISELAKRMRENSPQMLFQADDAACVVARRAWDFGVKEIIVDSPHAQRALAAEGVAAACDEGRIDALDLEGVIAASLDAAVNFADGARMSFEETAGGCVVDIDAGGAADATRSPNDKVNERAAKALFRELSRRSIGGRVIVDFLPPSSSGARRRLLDLLGAQDLGVYQRRPGKLAPDGLLDLTAPRRDLSLLERASEETGAELIRSGRQLTLDWTAKRAVAAIEARLARHPRLSLSLDAGAELARYIEERPQWLARLAERYGARTAVQARQGAARSFDVRER
jgi:Ribonuclease G/E